MFYYVLLCFARRACYIVYWVIRCHKLIYQPLTPTVDQINKNQVSTDFSHIIWWVCSSYNLKFTYSFCISVSICSKPTLHIVEHKLTKLTSLRWRAVKSINQLKVLPNEYPVLYSAIRGSTVHPKTSIPLIKNIIRPINLRVIQC